MLTLRLDMAAATVIYATGAVVLLGTQRIDDAGIRIPDRREHVVLAGDHLPARATRVVMRLRTAERIRLRLADLPSAISGIRR